MTPKTPRMYHTHHAWMMRGRAILVGALCIYSLFIFVAPPVYAQSTGATPDATQNLQTIQQTSGLGQNSFGVIVAQIIRVTLSLLGIITICIIIYGGFKYMTSSGNEEAVEHAKKIMVNGAIGLVIVLSSFAITQFILSKLSGATGTVIPGVTDQNQEGLSNQFGAGGYGGIFKVKYISPSGQQKYASVHVTVVLNAPIDETSVTKDTFSVTGPAGAVDGTTTIDGDVINFIPTKVCPPTTPPTATTQHCFEENTAYTVALVGKKIGFTNPAITSKVGQAGLVCTDTSCTGTFISGVGVDNNPPTVSNLVPADGDKVPVNSVIPVSGLANDDDALAMGRVSVDGATIETVTIPTTNGKLPAAFIIATNKFSTNGDKPKTQHAITVTAQDASGNTAQTVAHVTALPEHCFNKVKDGDEIAIDCSAAGGECGACSNGACTTTADCAAGLSCVQGVCSSTPIIQGVYPDNGAPGNFVSINGIGFGASGQVTFVGNPTDPTDDVDAPLACDGAWGTTQVIVQIPQGAQNGPVRLKNDAGSSDTTDNQIGVLLKEFKINDIVRPGLCSATPASGLPVTTQVTLHGTPTLSQPNADSKLFFGGYVADKPVWGDQGPDTVTAYVPNMESGETQIAAVVKGLQSNPLEFLVESSGNAVGAAPHIDSVTPASAAQTQYLTIKGAHFGITPNKVYFSPALPDGSMGAAQVAADFNFPAQCASTFWTDTQIIARVPKVGTGNFFVSVYAANNKTQSNALAVSVVDKTPPPEICAIVPDNGPNDGTLHITFYGDNFGVSQSGVGGSGEFVTKLVGLGTYGGNGIAQITVPKNAATGDTRLLVGDGTKQLTDPAVCDTNPESCSNPLAFTVRDCRLKPDICTNGTLCCLDGSCSKTCAAPPTPDTAAFAWCFSTGVGCAGAKPPRVIEDCSAPAVVPPTVPSPSPAFMWDSTSKALACPNAILSVKFTEPLDPKSVHYNQGTNSTFYVEECTGPADAPCATVAPDQVQLNDLVLSDNIDGVNAGLFAFPKTLKPSTTYRVTLTYNMVGINTNLQLQAPLNSKNTCSPTGTGVYCYTFATPATTDPCPIDTVSVSPPKYTATSLGPVRDPLSKFDTLKLWLPLAFPQDHCQVLDPNAYLWHWKPAPTSVGTPDLDFVFAEALMPDAVKTSFLAKQRTKTDVPAQISVTEAASQKSGSGTLKIDPGPPTVYEQCVIKGIKSPVPSTRYSGGDAVCVNAAVAVEINQPVIFAPHGFNVWKCTGTQQGSECAKHDTTPLVGAITETEISTNDWQYLFEPVNNFSASTWYAVELSTSTVGVGTYGLHMAQSTSCAKDIGYCYSFKTRASTDECALASVDVLPPFWSATDYGIQKEFDAKTQVYVDKEWHAQPMSDDACVILKNEFQWQWGVDAEHASFATIDPSDDTYPNGKYADTSLTQRIGVYKETEASSTIKILATAKNVTGQGEITASFPLPTIVDYEPGSCTSGTVCSNAQIAVTFSTPMDIHSLNNDVYLYAGCDLYVGSDSSQACAFTSSTLTAPFILSAPGKTALSMIPSAAKDSNDTKFIFQPATPLEKNKTYRIFMLAGPRSKAQKKLIGFNYPADADMPWLFSWAFTTGQQMCPVDKILVKPVDSVADAIGATQTFVAQALSKPDACYPNGQELNPNAYTWGWSSSDVSVADTTNNISTSSTQDFIMNGKGAVQNQLQMTTVSAVAGGTTGATSWKLFCGAPPAECPTGTFPGNDNCCHLPPKILSHYPKSGDTGICRNTLISFDVNDLLKKYSVTPDSVMVGIKTTEPCNGTKIGDYCYGYTPYDIKVVNTTQKDGIQIGHAFIDFQKMLPENTDVMVSVNVTGKATSSTLSVNNIPVQAEEWKFTTGKDPCELNEIEVIPPTQTFTKLTDSQDVFAKALSKQGGGYVPITSIPNVYAWNWQWLSPDQKVATIKISAADTATIVPGGTDGMTTISASAAITADNFFKPSTVGKQISGYLDINAALCENPWAPGGQIPYEINGSDQNITKFNENMGLWYCRTTKAGQPLLPNLVPVSVALSDVGNMGGDVFTTLDAFLLKDPNSGGAIGFRIEKNLKHLTPREWFAAKGFSGALDDVQVDGFEGVRSGNTVYVDFGNQTLTSQHTNILVMSISEPETPELVEIFNQLLNDITFARNLKDINFCVVQGAETAVPCTTSADCKVLDGQGVPGWCPSYESEFRRDLIRVTHVSMLTRAIEKIKAATGKYPLAATGTYIPGFVSSGWPSWDGFLASIGLKHIQDPAQQYVLCGQKVCSKQISTACTTDADCVGVGTCQTPPNPDATSNILDYNKDTCWDAKDQKYSCQEGSYVYHYQMLNNGDAYRVWAEFEEFFTNWDNPVVTYDAAGKTTTSVDAEFCFAGNMPQTAKNFCGDGAIGSGEQCDPPGAKVTAPESACPYGQAIKTCSASCTFDPSYQCVNKCGDGIIESPEVCDEGSKYNGLYNHCPADCGVATQKIIGALGACGDGIVQSNEVCDIASLQGKELAVVGSDTTLYGISCTGKSSPPYQYVANGQPTTDQGAITKIQGNMDNDNNDQVIAYATAFCNGALNTIKVCTDKSGHSLDKLCTDSTQCGGFPCVQLAYGTCSQNANLACITNFDCFPNPGSVCQKPIIGSKYALQKENSCNWDCKSTGPYCGDGIVQKEYGEECDGNETGANACVKFCTASCKWQNTTTDSATGLVTPVCVPPAKVAGAPTIPPGCGDGTLDPNSGEECDSGTSCDNVPKDAQGNYTAACKIGGSNGIACTAAYGANNSCQYCTTTCKRAFVTGGYCGDNVANGPEICDTSDFTPVCPVDIFDYSTQTCTNSCTVDAAKGGSCVDCGSQTYAFNTGSTPEKITSTAVATIKFVDPTLPWFPVRTITIPSFNYALKGVAGKPGLSLDAIPEWAKGVISYGPAKMTIDLGRKLKAGDACFVNKKGYTFDVYAAQDTSQNNALDGVDQQLNFLLMHPGSAFSYAKATMKITDPTKTDLSLTAIPSGQDGDYRIVVEHVGLFDPLIAVYPPVNLSGGVSTLPMLPISGQYTIDAVDDPTTNPVSSECTANGWEINGAPITYPAPVNLNIPGTQNYFQDRFYMKGANGGVFAGARLLSGCDTSGPFTQLESASVFDSSLGLVNGLPVVAEKADVFTIRAPYDKKSAVGRRAFYAATYQVVIKSPDAATSIAASNLVVKIYYLKPADQHVANDTNGGWQLVGILKPSDTDAVIAKDKAGIDQWLPANLTPDTTVVNGAAYGTSFSPDVALYKNFSNDFRDHLFVQQ